MKVNHTKLATTEKHFSLKKNKYKIPIKREAN